MFYIALPKLLSLQVLTFVNCYIYRSSELEVHMPNGEILIRESFETLVCAHGTNIRVQVVLPSTVLMSMTR